MNLRHTVGSLLIVGLEAAELTAVERAWLRLIRPAGVILFRRNIEEAAQTHALLEAAAALCAGPAFLCVDVEGGLVDRLRDLIARVPSAAEVAATGKKKLYREHGQLIGEEVALLGFNATFAPVLDLALPASAEVMRTRSTSPDPRVVTEYGGEFLGGLAKAGVLGAGKHFPGLGGGTLDSHHATPEVQRGWPEIWKEDLLPYRKLHRLLAIVMVAHAAYPRVKEALGPASVSRYWIAEVLQRKIGFDGLVLSDDMEMGGVLSRHSIEEASVLAIEAGTHLIEVCKDPALVLRTYEALLSEAERSRPFRRKIEEAAEHVARQKKRLLSKWQAPNAPTAAEVEAMRERVVKFSETVKQNQPHA